MSLLHQIAGKIIPKGQDRQNFENVHAICNLHLCYNFAFVLYENAQAFSQSDASNIFFHVHSYQHSKYHLDLAISQFLLNN